MALDRRKGLQTAERLLKQGKLQAALSELRKVSESAPNDLLTLNRLGDLLARQGRHPEAIDYYRRIAEQFASGGFVPKAIAIHKKILRLDPQNLESMVALGELYIAQKLNGEARSYLLHASNQYLQNKQFAEAKTVYETLVEAEPDDLRHRVRLAETKIALGDDLGGGKELMTLAASMLSGGQAGEAEKVYHRALELMPQAHEPLLGIADCLAVQGRDGEATEFMEKAVRGGSGSPMLAVELALRYEKSGNADKAEKLLDEVHVLQVSPEAWSKLFTWYLDNGRTDELWKRLDPKFKSEGGTNPAALVQVLESVGQVEEGGHIPALQRLFEAQKTNGDSQGTVAAVEWLVRAYRERSMHDEASLMLDQLRELDPGSAVLTPDRGTATPSISVADATSPEVTADPSVTPVAVETTSSDPEAPAVPLNRSDEEFVAGRMTQAEVLEKYGLRPQALEQLEEVTVRFPGHVQAQELRVGLLRATSDKGRLATGLVELAIALRAAGDSQAARQAADEARRNAPLNDETIALLERLQLGDSPAVASGAAVSGGHGDLEISFDDPAPIPVEPTETPSPEVEAPAPSAPPAPSLAPETLEAPEVDEPSVVAAAPPVPPTSAAPRKSPTRSPSPDMLEEIEQALSEGSHDDARQRVLALATLGYASDELDALGERVRAAIPVVQESPPEAAPAPPSVADEVEVSPEAVDAPVDDEDDDLRAITAALENELFDADTPPLVPEEDPEQSIDEIFKAFKEQVQEEVGSEDFRTHYDLGIAYKEMGLIEEAIGEFEASMGDPSLFCVACSMIAMCHRELERNDQAAHWYRKALDRSDDSPESTAGLRYDLAEVLLDSGDAEGALELFRDVMNANPEYRDVSGRVSEIEGILEASPNP